MGNFTVMHYLHILADNCISGNPTLILSSDNCVAFITNVIVFQSQISSFHSLCHLHFVHFVTVKLFVVSTEPSCGALGVACYLQLWWCFFFRTEVGKWEVHHFPVDVPQTQGAQTQVQK